MPDVDDVPPVRRPGSRGPARSGTANLRDVAALAGVSPATASRVFAGVGAVQPETRDRVQAAADELGYVVNGLARAMQGRGTRTIAFVARTMIGPTFAALAAGVERVAGEQGHLLSISTTQGSVERERDLVTMLVEQRVAALLLVGSSETDTALAERVDGYRADLARVGAPLLLCGRPAVPGVPAVVSVDYDHVAGIRAAVDHLVGLGHRRIAYVGQKAGMSTPELRYDGYVDALRRHGIPVDESITAQADNTEVSSAAAVEVLLLAQPSITALVAMTDSMAVGAYRAARAVGLRIPEDLSIVGFDDVPVVADLSPGLTTVRPPFFEVGVRAGEIALGLRPAVDALLQVEFVERGSTAAPGRGIAQIASRN